MHQRRNGQADDESGVCSLFRSLINPQIQLIQRRIQLAKQRRLWMWSDSSMVPSPFWIRLFVRGLKIHVLWTSQCPYNEAPVATGGSKIQFWFLLGLRARQPRQRGLVVQWRPVSTGCKGGSKKRQRAEAESSEVSAVVSAAPPNVQFHEDPCEGSFFQSFGHLPRAATSSAAAAASGFVSPCACVFVPSLIGLLNPF